VYAAEAVGVNLGGTSGFMTNFGGLSTTQFIAAVSSATGVGASFIATWLANWLTFYSANTSAIPASFASLPNAVTLAAYGATFGDAIGNALIAPASLNLPLTTIFSTNSLFPFSPNTVHGQVANALINLAESQNGATAQYPLGTLLAALPPHLLLTT
jgi:hypothetical protein